MSATHTMPRLSDPASGRALRTEPSVQVAPTRLVRMPLVRPSVRTGWARAGLLGLGWLCVGLAAAGLILPLVPATPFLLAALACFAQSSARCHAWLLTSRWFGPVLREWRSADGGGRTMIVGITLLTTASCLLTILVLGAPVLGALVAAAGMVAISWSCRRRGARLPA